MDPVTMMIMAMASTALQAGGKLFAGFTGHSMAKMRSDIEMQNSQLYATQADTALLDKDITLSAGAFQQGKIASHVDARMGGQLAGYAARGLDPTYGSPLVAQMLSAAQGETDKALVSAQARLEASNAVGRAASLHNKAASAAYGASMDEYKGWTDMVSGIIGAGSAILGGGKGGSFGGGGGGSGGDPLGGGGGDPLSFSMG